MKKIAFVLMLLLPMIVVIHFSAPVKAEPKIIYVDDDNTAGPWDGTSGHPYQNITNAVKQALIGDTIYVYNGTYQEWNIVLDKDNLSLIGENRDITIIDGGSRYYWVLIITAQNVTVTGFTIQNSPVGTGGIFLNHAIGSKISNNIIKNHDSGIYSAFSNGNVIENNWVADNDEGIILSTDCKENKIRGNTVTDNTLYTGIDLSNGAHDNVIENNNIVQNKFGIFISSENNSIFGNQIVKNDVGISEYSGPTHEYYGPTHGYTILHNNLINNTRQLDLGDESTNMWDNGLEGNYWSDYNGTDFDQDGIGEASYIINGNNTDHYPLMGTFSEFPVTWEEKNYPVTTICNSTISAFQFNYANRTIEFNVTVEEGIGFCRVTIPKIIIQDVWDGNYTVLVNREGPIMMNNWTDTENTYIYFTYQQSEHEVIIIPEFPIWTSLLIILIMLTGSIAIYKRNLHKAQIHLQ